jgi:MFS family permease
MQTSMPAKILRLVLLISCAHALVHMYELSLPSVEHKIAAEYYPEKNVENIANGKEMTGLLSMTWRIPWGIGAMLAGLLVDRFGAKRLLLVYLIGVSIICGLVRFTQPLSLLFVTMFCMGLLASIYHPAGLSWISHRTTSHQRPFALGIHGILGSLGIAAGPLLVATMYHFDFSWRDCYSLLAFPGMALAIVLAFYRESKDTEAQPATEHDLGEGSPAVIDEQEDSDWLAFFVLTTVSLAQGIVYAGVLSFLPRYMAGWSADAQSSENAGFYATGVLVMGCIGQYIAGSIARPEKLERQLCWVALANAPLLIWMAMAEGQMRFVAAATFSIVHFMHQPIYNSLIAKYSTSSRRSLAYGFSIAMGLGVGGGVGAVLVGFNHRQDVAFFSLAGVAILSGIIAHALSRIHNRKRSTNKTS